MGGSALGKPHSAGPRQSLHRRLLEISGLTVWGIVCLLGSEPIRQGREMDGGLRLQGAEVAEPVSGWGSLSGHQISELLDILRLTRSWQLYLFLKQGTEAQ